MENTKGLFFTPEEVCEALEITDYDDYDREFDGLSALEIAGQMLSGAVKMEDDELERLADYKGVGVGLVRDMFRN